MMICLYGKNTKFAPQRYQGGTMSLTLPALFRYLSDTTFSFSRHHFVANPAPLLYLSGTIPRLSLFRHFIVTLLVPYNSFVWHRITHLLGTFPALGNLLGTISLTFPAPLCNLSDTTSLVRYHTMSFTFMAAFGYLSGTMSLSCLAPPYYLFSNTTSPDRHHLSHFSGTTMLLIRHHFFTCQAPYHVSDFLSTTLLRVRHYITNLSGPILHTFPALGNPFSIISLT